MTFADCRLQTADCRPQTADQRLQTADCRPKTADQRLQTADQRLLTIKVTSSSIKQRQKIKMEIDEVDFSRVKLQQPRSQVVFGCKGS